MYTAYPIIGGVKDVILGMEDGKEQRVDDGSEKSSPEEVDHERAYFDSADWALGKQGVEKPKGPLEALRPKLQPTQQQTRYRKSPCAPADGEDGGSPASEDTAANE
ncbi:hypothetical protein DVH24_030835 [Malus domestica]|uniref:Negatively light-regulated protein n=1 Tax=Malus domestica TaxID=3750 RepID=A0A498HF53_MALDO|nr:hypothetical protein DVH24_030835 [Malus domestica]